ncbi:hypothetical protein MKX03_017512, partial [Papaver bracteatum]
PWVIKSEMRLVQIISQQSEVPTSLMPVTRTASSGSGTTWKASSAEIMADSK